MNDEKHKIIAIQLSDDSYFIISHRDSKYIDYTNEIIDTNTLFNEFIRYSRGRIILMDEILLVKDINNNLVDYDKLYEIFESIIVSNQLMYGTPTENQQLFLLEV